MSRRNGFTIVELLIVIVVIAILAAITVVAYRGIQNRAYDSAIQQDLANFGKKMGLQKIDNGGTYPATLTSSMGFRFTKNAYGIDTQSKNVRFCYNTANDSYILIALSKSGNIYRVINGVVESATYALGFSVCSQIGLASTNPSQDGYFDTRTPQWDTWTN